MMVHWKACLVRAIVAGSALVGVAAGQTELLRIRGVLPDDSYGWAIGPAGDVDGDGIGDVLVGSSDDDTNGTDAGRVRVLSGRDGSLLREHFGDKAHDRLGFAIGKQVGDVDGDGFDDYALGAMETPDLASFGLGYVRVFSGPTGSKIREWIGTELEAAYGERPTVIGDIDNDGFADVAVGAVYADFGGLPSAGQAFIYSGKDNSTLWTKGGASASDYYGSAIAPVGLVDADSRLDFAVGSFGKTTNGYQRGGVEVISGMTGAVLFSEIGGIRDQFGWSLAGVGDLDQDGIPDLLVGSCNDNSPDRPGEAHVYSLKTGAELYCFAGPTDGDLFGYAVAALDDLDGDGVNEFLIGAPVGSYAQPWRGHAYVYSGYRGRLLYDLATGIDDDVFGEDLMVHDDVDGDGLREWIVGAPASAYGLPSQPGTLHFFTSRDCRASATNYGAGWPGTLGVPSLTASNPPWLGEDVTIDLGNAAGVPTIALVLLGFGKAQQPSSWDGDFLVAAPWVSFTFALPTAGLALPEAVDPDLLLCGLEVDVQMVHLDPGASDGIAFSAGLELLLGGR